MVVQWTVEKTPVAGTLAKTPNTAAVCAGTNVSAALTAGSGGNGTDELQYSYDNSTWNAYTSGNNITTTGYANVYVRTRRMATYCTPSAYTTVSWTVNPLPTASISGTTPACTSTLLTASTNATTPSYQWKLGGSNISGATSSTYTATASGTYTVTITDGSTGCSNTSADYAVVIDAMPTAYNVTGGPFCAGGNISIGLSNSQSGYSYTLYKDAESMGASYTQTGTGSALTFTVNSAAAGTYTIQATNGTCQVAMTGSATVNPAPTANAGADASTCVSSAYTVSDASASNYASIAWTEDGAGSITADATTLTPTYTPAAGDAGNTVTLTLTATALGGCTNVSDTKALYVYPASVGGTATATASTVCSGTGTTITLTGYTGTIQWQSSTNGTDYSNITDATASTLNTGNLTATTYYRAVVTSGSCSSANSSVATVTVNPAFTAGAIASGDETICYNGDPANIAEGTAASGGDGTYIYKWQSTTAATPVEGDWSDISGATSTSYDPPTGLTTTTKYRRLVSDELCSGGYVASSGVRTVTVRPQVTGTISGTATICAGSSTQISVALTGTANWSLTYTDGTTPVTVTGITASPYTFNVSPSATTTYTLTAVSDANCTGTYSGSAVVTVNPLPTITLGASPSVCAGITSANLPYTGTTNSPTQYRVDFDATAEGQGFADVVYTALPATPITITVPGGATAGTYNANLYVKNANNCESAATAFTVEVKALPTITSASVSPTSACGSGTFTFSATPSAGTVVWYTASTGGSVVSDVTDIVLSTTTTYYAEAVNGSCVSAARTAVTATVNPLPTPSISGDNSVCAGEAGVVYSTANVSGHTYSWTVTGGTITSGAGTNSITVTWGTGTTGTVDVTETITATGCSANATQLTVTVNPLPDADITASGATTFCQGGSVTLTADEPTDGGTTYQWRESGTAITGETGRTYVATSSGSYTVTVTKNGCSATTATATTVTVNALPVITTTATNQTRCGSGDVTFTAATTSTNGVIDWSASTDFASYTTGTSKTVSITAGTTENYYYRARNTATGCISTYLTVSGTAYTLPSTTITGNTTVVVSTDLNLSSADAMTTYNWTATGSPTITNATSQTATFNWSSTGNYTVTLTYTNANGCENTATHNVEVTGSPITPTKLKITNIVSQTSGTAFNVTVQSVDDGDNLGNVTSATGFTLSVNTGSGTLSGTVSGTIASGSNSATVSVTYTKNGGETGVSLLATRTSGMALANGTSNTFTVLAAEPSQAAISSISRTTTTATVNLTAGGGSRRLLVIQQGNGSTIASPTDGNRYTANPVYSLGEDLGSSTYVVLDSNVTSVLITGLQRNKTLYTVQVFEMAWDGSNDETVNYNTSSAAKMSFRTLLKESENEGSLISGNSLQMTSVNPNPATENVNFTIYADEMAPSNIEIVNEVGAVVMALQRDLSIGENHISLNINSEKGGLPSGTYFLRVTSGGETIQQKFIYMP